MVNTHTHTHNSASRKGPRTCFARWWYKKIFLSHTHCEKSIVHASLHECTHRPTHQVHQSFTSSRSANMHLNLHAPACAGQSITWCQLCRTRAAHPNPQSPPQTATTPLQRQFLWLHPIRKPVLRKSKATSVRLTPLSRVEQAWEKW